MKFARYLQDTQTPEWQKAYIDYRGLKVQLGIVRRQQVTASSPGATDHAHSDDAQEAYSNRSSSRVAGPLASGAGPLTNVTVQKPNDQQTSTAPFQHSVPHAPRISRSSPALTFSRDSAQAPPYSSFAFAFLRNSVQSLSPLPLHAMLSNLPASHAKFFGLLDAELEKVDSFYAEREREMSERATQLREQLDKLVIHRKLFHQSSAHTKARGLAEKIPSALARTHMSHDEADRIGDNGRRGINSRARNDGSRFWAREATSRNEDMGNSVSPRTLWNEGEARHAVDPHVGGYHHAKRQLRKAMIEHYRGLEVLNNYRILNLIGFRKALKKYDKTTKSAVMDAYMNEKVEPSVFASGALVSTMLKEMEDMFAVQFEHGDRKKALNRLRVGPLLKTHHFSTFRSGLLLGIALPAIAAGTYLSFQQHTRESLPSWNILLFIYSVLVLPVLLAILIGVNLAVWARERINYVFIFELSPRSRLDHHEYFELPCFFFCTLAYAFWFSMAQIGPTLLWPLIWLALIVVTIFNPIRNFMWGPARWWTIRNMAKLGISGIWKVEFTDFWLGDQLCSLVYSLSGMYFMGCFYARFFSDFPLSTEPALTSDDAARAWSTCGVDQNWEWYSLLSVLPFLARFVQSLRRYWDSKLPTHLINAGKYATGMVYYFFYYYWRHQGGAGFVRWFFVGIVYSIYGCVWDVLMDWSLFRPHARYPLLRPELVYKSQIPLYYVALVSNFCVRFLWVTYVPVLAPSMGVRTFVVATLEVVRRVQWNFYRLENEHLGNIDQYRVVREVPLPYSFEVQSVEEEEHEEEGRKEEEEHEEEEREGESGKRGEEVGRGDGPSGLTRRSTRSRKEGHE